MFFASGASSPKHEGHRFGWLEHLERYSVLGYFGAENTQLGLEERTVWSGTKKEIPHAKMLKVDTLIFDPPALVPFEMVLKAGCGLKGWFFTPVGPPTTRLCKIWGSAATFETGSVRLDPPRKGISDRLRRYVDPYGRLVS